LNGAFYYVPAYFVTAVTTAQETLKRGAAVRYG